MRGGWRFVALGLGLTACFAGTAQTGPVGATPPATPAALPGKNETPLVFYTGKGQFEIIAIDEAAAQEALILASVVWRALAEPLALPPAGFSSAVAVRLVPGTKWKGPAAFSVAAEPGGMVGVRIGWDEKTDMRSVRRALVEAILLRQAVAWHGAAQRATVPLWLEQACIALSEVRERPAMLDAMQQESAHLKPPSLETVLRMERGAAASRGCELAAFWLFQYLETEAEPDALRWTGWLRTIMGGSDPMQVLQQTYGRMWRTPAERELWWQVGFYNECRSSILPLMSMEETRNWLADRCRWLVLRGGYEQVLSLEDLWTFRSESWVRAGFVKRIEQLQNQLPRLHPFYRNAAISMGRMYQAAVTGDERDFKAAQKALSQDAVDGRELEDETGSALEALEATR